MILYVQYDTSTIRVIDVNMVLRGGFDVTAKDEGSYTAQLPEMRAVTRHNCPK